MSNIGPKERELVVLCVDLIDTVGKQTTSHIDKTRRFSSIRNLAFAIYRKSLEVEFDEAGNLDLGNGEKQGWEHLAGEVLE